MSFKNRPNHYQVEFRLTKRRTTSGASRNVSFIKSGFAFQAHHKKLSYIPKSVAGRNCTGRIVVRTKGRRLRKLRRVKFNRSFRELGICFIAGFYTLPFLNKLASLVFVSSGGATFLQSTTYHEIWRTSRLKSLFFKRSHMGSQMTYYTSALDAYTQFFLIINLPKNKPVCLLELLPERGVQYARGIGTKAIILRLDTRTSISMIKLPSGVRKLFSIYSVGSKGSVALPENKKCANNSAGWRNRAGKKSITRGVAKNPVDHPHGGRNKAIRYQRSPWGKTTKYK